MQPDDDVIRRPREPEPISKNPKWKWHPDPEPKPTPDPKLGPIPFPFVIPRLTLNARIATANPGHSYATTFARIWRAIPARILPRDHLVMMRITFSHGNFRSSSPKYLRTRLRFTILPMAHGGSCATIATFGERHTTIDGVGSSLRSPVGYRPKWTRGRSVSRSCKSSVQYLVLRGCTSMSLGFPGFDRIYVLDDPVSGIYFRAGLSRREFDPIPHGIAEMFRMTAYGLQPPPTQRPRLYHGSGRATPSDIVWPMGGVMPLVSDRMINLLSEYDVTGWDSFNVEIVDRNGVLHNTHHRLMITSKPCGRSTGAEGY